MRRVERRVADGEAPSVEVIANSHSEVSMKRTPKLNGISVTADERRMDVLIPNTSIAAFPYVTAFIGSGTSIPTTFSVTIE